MNMDSNIDVSSMYTCDDCDLLLYHINQIESVVESYNFTRYDEHALVQEANNNMYLPQYEEKHGIIKSIGRLISETFQKILIMLSRINVKMTYKTIVKRYKTQFEENGVPFTPFYGGFGLVANGLIQKPTYWTFKFFKDLKAQECTCVYRDKNCVVVQTKDGVYKGIAWNLTLETKASKIGFNFELALKAKETKRYFLMTKTVDEETTNPLKIWHDMGEPANPCKDQIELLRMSGKPLVNSQSIDAAGGAKFNLTAKKNGVIYFELKEAPLTSDNGYDYNFYDKVK